MRSHIRKAVLSGTTFVTRYEDEVWTIFSRSLGLWEGARYVLKGVTWGVD